MTFRHYLLLMGFATLLAWMGWVLVLFQLNPDEVGWLGMVAFFLTLFLGLVGAFATISMSYRVLRLNRPVISREARISFRHAVLLGTVSCLWLFLASHDALHIWTFLLVVAVFGGIEGVSLWLDRHQRV